MSDWDDPEAWLRKQGARQREDGVYDNAATFEGRALEYAMDLDRRWFEEHPRATEYVRESVEGEWPAPPEGVAKVKSRVLLVGPGVRARQPIFIKDSA